MLLFSNKNIKKDKNRQTSIKAIESNFNKKKTFFFLNEGFKSALNVDTKNN